MIIEVSFEMVKQIIEKIEKDKRVDMRELLNELKISSILLEYVLKGMEKKEYIKSVKCSECEFNNSCPIGEKHCKGFGKYWILTGKDYEN